MKKKMLVGFILQMVGTFTMFTGYDMWMGNKRD